MLVRMELSRILIRELNDFQVIELREVPEDGEPLTDPRSFPIVIGLPEAQAIERRLKGVAIQRPQTHDLLANIIEALGASLESIAITELRDHTYFAMLDVRNAEGEAVQIDARPSDAIALGIAGEVPIYVDDAVIAAAQESE
ncbi:MAG: bifunctional nuclease family protein [Planctomycetota bacterium]|nr:bifunctional nuclease family protein [Planctomycetota bacterium]